MTIQEANALLASAPASENKRSRINNSMSQAQAVDIVRKGLGPRVVDASGHLIPIYEKRVYQVARNQRRPSYQP